MLRFVSKIGVFALALLLFASPTMACLLPNAELTAAEKACCRQMAHQCDRAGMPKSHSCCQPTGISVVDSSLIKTATPKATQPTVVTIHQLPVVAQAISDLCSVSSMRSES